MVNLYTLWISENCRLAFVGAVLLGCAVLAGCSVPVGVMEERAEEARVFPDYGGGLVIPPNIAPMNFEVMEEGRCVVVQIAAKGNTLWEMRHRLFNHSRKSASSVSSASSSRNSHCRVTIPERAWKTILKNHLGDTLEVRVMVGDAYSRLTGYKPLQWVVSADSIDPFVVFRHIAMVGAPGTTPQPIGIYERNLENFDTRTLTETQLVDNACMNCHHFSANRSSRMCIHFRRSHAGTLITTPDSAFMVNLSLPDGEKGVFGAFSPNERYLAFSTNQLTCIHDMKIKRLKTWSFDTEANILVYDVEANAILSTDELMAEGFQKTYPCWSHDGAWLYFCQSNWQPNIRTDTTRSIFERIQSTHYALVRTPASFSDLSSPVHTLIAPQDIDNQSISFPACSPDGRFITFSTTAFGTLDPLSTDGRLWLYDLHTNVAKEIEPEVENPIVSSSGWSSGARWVVVASRRMDGLYSRVFLVHIDTLGNASKPFVMPQKNPGVYRKQDYSYSLPELIAEPVPMHAYDIARAVRKPAKQPTYLYNFKVPTTPPPPAMGKHTE